MIDAIELLNDLNDAVGKKPRTLCDMVTASSLLLASALRQIEAGEKGHGVKRAREIGAGLPGMVENEDQAYRKFFEGEPRHE